jgi:predicted membrane protein
MRMTSLIFGIFVILFGLSIIINIVFKVDIPVFKICIGLFFLYLGFRMIFGSMYCNRMNNSGSTFFCSRHYNASDENENTEKTVIINKDGHSDTVYTESEKSSFMGNKKQYDIVFGSSVIDLREIVLKENVTTVNINTVFGSSKIFINKNIPYKITTDVAFGSVKLPDGNSAGFGNSKLTNTSINDTTKYLNIKVNVVFGSSEIRY